MNLYERDYGTLQNDEERIAQQEYILYYEKKPEEKIGFRCNGGGPEFVHPNYEIRKLLWHYNSLFPNNYLWHLELRTLNHKKESNEFINVLDQSRNEKDVQDYIKNMRKWFIPASLYKEYNFGHHGAYLFPEVRLGTEYRCDYMLLGLNSDGYSIVLVEFEDVNVPYMLEGKNTESESVRKGLTQIRDWKRWIDDNRLYFLRSFSLTEKGIRIPSYRFHYCLVVSRRKLMNSVSRDLRSQTIYKTPNLKIVSYDRLADNILKLTYSY